MNPRGHLRRQSNPHTVFYPPLHSVIIIEEFAIVHLLFLHKTGSNNPTGISSDIDKIPAPTSNAEEAEVERFYEDLQNFLGLTPKKDVLFIMGDWNSKVGSQETPGVTGNFGLGIQNEVGERLIAFCQDITLVIANTPFQQHKRKFYMWTSPGGQQ